MMGRTHVLSGAAAGLATLPIAPVDGLADQVAWVLLWAGATLLPDLDSPGASASRMWGPISRAISIAISRCAGGHRWGTLDLLLGPLAFGGAAALAVLVPAAAFVVVAISLGLVIHALHVTRVSFTGPVLNLILSWAGASWVVSSGWVTIGWWLPLAIAGGVVVAIIGDWLTHEGVPIPLVWIRDRSRRWGLGAFRTGAVVETAVIAPVLTIAIVALTLMGAGGIEIRDVV